MGPEKDEIERGVCHRCRQYSSQTVVLKAFSGRERKFMNESTSKSRRAESPRITTGDIMTMSIECNADPTQLFLYFPQNSSHSKIDVIVRMVTIEKENHN